MPSLNLLGPRRDAGATATIVGLLLAFGVLTGMTALVVDVGRLYNEREELQSGADAAAMAIALDCANRDDPARVIACADAFNTANNFADANAKDGASALGDDDSVCFSDAAFGPVCTGLASSNLTDCLPVPDSAEAATFVEVRTKTEVKSGSYLLPMFFAQTLVSGIQGTTVGACARVGWGSPSSGLALTFCLGEWEDATGGGATLGPALPELPNPSFEKSLKLRAPGPGGGGPCDSSAGKDLPGAFGWTDTDASLGPCMTKITSEGEYSVDPGASIPKDRSDEICGDLLMDLHANPQVVLVPIYNEAVDTGTKGKYLIEGFAAFVITGWSGLSGGIDDKNKASWLPGSTVTCDSGYACLYGYFTRAIVPFSGEFGSTGDFGATVVKTIG